MPSRKEILEDIRANNIQLAIFEYSEVKGDPDASATNGRDATDEDIKNMDYWELRRNWEQAKHTRDIIAGIKRA